MSSTASPLRNNTTSTSTSSSPSSSSNKPKRKRNKPSSAPDDGSGLETYLRNGVLLHRRKRRAPSEISEESRAKQSASKEAAASSSSAAPASAPIPPRYAAIAEHTNFIHGLPALMYASGDVEEPLPETVLLMDQLLTSYLSSVLVSCQNVIAKRRDRLTLANFLYVLRRWPERRERVLHVLRENQVRAKGLTRKNHEDREKGNKG